MSHRPRKKNEKTICPSSRKNFLHLQTVKERTAATEVTVVADTTSRLGGFLKSWSNLLQSLQPVSELLNSVALQFPFFVVSELRPLHSHSVDVENVKSPCPKCRTRSPDDHSIAP